MHASATENFVKSLPVQERFTDALPRSNYIPIPDNWFVAVTDVVQSREAISKGRYKAVNMAGVSMISAIMNAIGHQDVPYIFGGDGAAVVFAPEDFNAVEEQLSAIVGWAEDELKLTLRAAIVPMSEVKSAGHDVLAAAVKVSPAIINFAFLGGGITFAEKLMKEGAHWIERAPAGTMPNLTGLSCRWRPVAEDRNTIVSLIVEPAEGQQDIPSEITTELLSLIRTHAGESISPVSESRLSVVFQPQGIALEASATKDSLWRILLFRFLAWGLNLTGLSLGEYDPVRYRKFLALNTDYRKIQDGLRMTISLEPEVLLNLRKFLETQRNLDKLRYGICEQKGALLTCYVPSFTSDDHFHFLDGAGGGYAAAADNLK